MAVSIRLSRYGAKKSPFYRIVVMDSQKARDGRFIEQVGTYDPRKEPSEIVLQEEAVLKWLGSGARPTETVKRFLKSSGIWARFCQNAS
ncbi:MAG: 30S ribosomal protein S16 [Deltaproteobacteria bacterium]|nr:30S ribosomal protein S16 [Deltaproteobacteria bacterium]